MFEDDDDDHGDNDDDDDDDDEDDDDDGDLENQRNYHLVKVLYSPTLVLITRICM